MKLGPIHVVRDVTLRDMQQRMEQFHAQKHEAETEAARLREFLREPVNGISPRHTLMHAPDQASLPTGCSADMDPDTPEIRAAVARVVAAYQRTRAMYQPQAPGLWDGLEANNRPFVDALDRGDERTVQGFLRGLFESPMIFGLGYGVAGYAEVLRRFPHGNPHQLRFTDTLRSLAEAVAALPLTSPEQGPQADAQALSFDLDAAYREIQERTGLDADMPRLAAISGFELAGRFITTDALVHTYTLHRLRELGAKSDTSVVEIGGGYGCLAHLAHRAGVRRYTIIDLPWVAALQGYFLLRALPPEAVQLFGEAAAPVRVLPPGCFHDLPARSVDYLVNTNSLPEMGEPTGRAYLETARRVLRGTFLSINQEAQAPVAGCGPQLWVARLIDQMGGWRRLARSRYWLRRGYAEEVYQPVGDR